MNNSVFKEIKKLQSSLLPVAQETSLYEAETILEHFLHCTRVELYTQRSNSPISEQVKQAINIVLKRRLQNEPLPYILQNAYFYSANFLVTSDVLIPRPETEILVQTILENEENNRLLFLDVGLGSGAISASLLQERNLWRGIGLDISLAAIRVAKKNIITRGLFLCSNMFSALSYKSKPFDFIVSNPPYISLQEMSQLDTSVLHFEPHSALYGGVDGLDFYRILTKQGLFLVKRKGKMYCEIGVGQDLSVQALFEENNWKDCTVIKDLSQRSRVLVATAP